MPRIRASTVAEHRAAQHRALLDAAREILAETGQPPTLTQVAARAGLARPSLYQYFRSSEDLLNAVVQDVFPRWSARVAAAMDAAATPADRVLAYVLTNFELITEGEHALATVLAEVAPGDMVAEQSRAMHKQLLEPLVETLRRIGVPTVAETAEMINAIVFAGSRLIESGTDLRTTWESARTLLEPFVRTSGQTTS
ncbi:TetR family transcriptional regulator [Sphaerisporangium melleum]|uniref:TetR family transcriptional regulator n=1 Tax=Sphaerisporangium melleum TaxID=321316 RepID=A0A917VGQ6_9ACTN|nr:TetR/AcrR family transcriptional regulator [Sphaerisporangium melleum]GGK74112.1 TetR family transcriptional regulator [Sphaerisporangium melleum]GII70875.1 TetR family transcriptional regulator [Sphaerisporangium melleum]